MESGVYESGNEQKTSVQKREKTGCHRKKKLWMWVANWVGYST